MPLLQISMKTILITLSCLLPITQLTLAQSSFTYAFVDPDTEPWPSDWSGSVFADERHHADGWGFDSSIASDKFTGAYIGDQSNAVVGAKYHNTESFDIEKDALTYTMSWNPNGLKGFIDIGSSGKGDPNQIFQIGFFNGTPASSWFGQNLSSTAGTDSLYLAGTEISADPTTQQGSLNLGVYDESGTQLADFGNLNYTAVDANGAYIYNFRQDIQALNVSQLSYSLWMDIYQVNGVDTTTYLGQTSYGTQTITHGLNSVSSLVPGVGISVKDISTVSITAANYDGGVAVVVVPEPSTIALMFAGSLALIGYRRRRS